MARAGKDSRRQQILEALASELEHRPGERITTARLAGELGVSEAALYRHFPSKARMFEGLIEFAEESVFTLIGRILAEEANGAVRCRRIVGVLLTFSSRNPGITRVLTGSALVGEHVRLRARASQFFDRIETQLRQVLREDTQLRSGALAAGPGVAANAMLAFVEGRMAQFERSAFRRSPTEDAEAQWAVLERGLFRP